MKKVFIGAIFGIFFLWGCMRQTPKSYEIAESWYHGFSKEFLDSALSDPEWDINAPTKTAVAMGYGSSQPPLIVAIRNYESVKLLLQAGADANLCYCDGGLLCVSPFSAAVDKLIYAVDLDRPEKEKKEALDTLLLLHKHGADVNAKCQVGMQGYYVRMTPIMMAVGDDYVTSSKTAFEVAKTLLDLGANPYIQDSKGQNAFDYLNRNVDMKNKESIKKLLQTKIKK